MLSHALEQVSSPLVLGLDLTNGAPSCVCNARNRSNALHCNGLSPALSLLLGCHTSGEAETNMDLYWPIIANREALAVNAAWFGDPGTLLKQSNQTTHMPCATRFASVFNSGSMLTHYLDLTTDSLLSGQQLSTYWLSPEMPPAATAHSTIHLRVSELDDLEEDYGKGESGNIAYEQ